MGNSVVSIVGTHRKIAKSPAEIPLHYMTEVEDLGLTQWYDSHGNLDEAQASALKTGAFDGVIVIAIDSRNGLSFLPAR